MARILLPQPPRSRGVLGLMIGLALVGWVAYLISTFKGPSLLSSAPPAETSGPAYVELDLRGPQYDAGRYQGFLRGNEAAAKGFTPPVEKVLVFQADEAAQVLQLNTAQAEDFSAGYQSGFSQAFADAARKKASSVPPQK